MAFDPSQFSKENPGVTAAMAMKRGKHKKKKPAPKAGDHSSAAARKLAMLNKGKSGGSNPYQ